jgi:hypothetical protein
LVIKEATVHLEGKVLIYSRIYFLRFLKKKVLLLFTILGEYTAVVGEAETSMELTVVELPPVFTKKISPVTVTAGT